MYLWKHRFVCRAVSSLCKQESLDCLPDVQYMYLCSVLTLCAENDDDDDIGLHNARAYLNILKPWRRIQLWWHKHGCMHLSGNSGTKVPFRYRTIIMKICNSCANERSYFRSLKQQTMSCRAGQEQFVTQLLHSCVDCPKKSIEAV